MKSELSFSLKFEECSALDEEYSLDDNVCEVSGGV